MKRTKRNNRRLKGGINRSSNNSTKKNDKCVINFYDGKITWMDYDKGKPLVRGRSPPCSRDGLPRPGFNHKRAPRSIKQFKKGKPDGSLDDNTYTNESKVYYLSNDKKSIPRCNLSHKKACIIENNKLNRDNRDNYFIKKPKKSKGGKKSSYKSRKSGKK